jgi:branched-chain amino acid transport system substrate-binding protein
MGYKYLFSNFPKVDDYARAFIALLNSFPKEQRPTTIALFEGMHDIGVETAKYGEKEATAGGYKSVRVKFEWFTKDLSAAILEAKRAGSDAVYGIMHTPVSILLVKQMKELDYNPKAVYISMGPTNPIPWATLGKDGDYICTHVEFLKGVEWPGAKEFIAMHQVDRPKDGDYFEHAAMGYASTQVIADAIKRAGSIDRKKIREALAATDMMTIVGPTKFRADGTMQIPYPTIAQYQGGVQTIIFPEKRKQKPAIYPMPKWKER